MKFEDNDPMGDFEDFMKLEANQFVDSQLRVRIERRLFPSRWLTFGKLLAIHFVVGFLSLAICHQFALNPFATKFSLADLVMSIGGHSFCMIFCGFFFMSSTYLFANFILSLEEFETIRRSGALQLFILTSLSLVGFVSFGGHVIATVAILWLLGALCGGLLSLELSYRLRAALA